MPLVKWIDGVCSKCGKRTKKINGPWLREQRRSARLTLRAVAEQQHVSYQFLSMIEQNKRSPTPALIEFYESL